MTKSVDDRSPMAKAVARVSQITTICLMMIIPAILGYFVDQWLQSVLVFTVLGLVFGMASAIYQLVKLVSQMNATSNKNTSDPQQNP